MSEIKYLDKIGLQHLVEEIDKKHFARIVTYKPGFGTIITPNNNIVAEVKYEQRDTEWKSFSWTNAGWLSGSHIWVDYNGVIHYDWDFQSDHKYLAEDGVTWVTKTWKGFSGINGSRVWMDYNNNIHYDYSNVHYILGSDNETWEAYTYTGLTVIDRGLWTDYDGIIHYDNGTSHYKLLSDCKTWEEVKWPDVVITAGEKVWKDASGVLHYDAPNTHAVLSDTGVWRKYTWIGDISIPNGDHVWKSTNGIYHYDDGSTHYVLDENMTWSTFSWPGNVDITANYIWNDPNGITHYDYKDNSNNYHFYLEKEEHKYITNHGDELQTKLTAGSNITIENGVISSTGGGSTDNFYTKAEVDEKISTIPKFSTKVVSALPTSDISTTTIYLLVSSSSKTGNLYTEYIYVDSKWEKLGEQTIDLSGYATTTALSAKQDSLTAAQLSAVNSGITSTKVSTYDGYATSIGNKVDKASGKGLSTNDYTTTEKNKLAGIAEGANNYSHPTYTSKTSGLYKITVDGTGHVSGTAAVTASDLPSHSHTGYLTSESDPVFSASAAAGITSADITNWNGKTSNTGTVTQVKIGSTAYSPTSGVISLPAYPTVSYPVTSVAGKTGAVTLSSSDVGLGNVGNFKAVSTVASQGLTDTEKSNARANIGAGTSNLALGTTATTAAAGNHTHSNYLTGITKAMVTTALGYTPPTSDTNTWRGIQNNLTSTSTTDSLSAAQGKVLNDKFASYLPLTGGTLTGDLTLNSSGSISSGNTKAVTGGTVYDYCKNAVKYINLNGESIVSGQPGDKRAELHVVPNTSYLCSRTGSVGELECICETESLTTIPMTLHFFIKNNLDAKLCGNLTVVWDGSNFTLSTDNVHLQAYICVEHYDEYGYIYGRVYTQGVKWSVQTLDTVKLFNSNGSFTESLSNITPVWANCYSSTTKFHICFYVQAYVGGLTPDKCTVSIASNSKVPLDWNVVSSRYYKAGNSRLLELSLSSDHYQNNYTSLRLGYDMSITYGVIMGLKASLNDFSISNNASNFILTINTDSIANNGGFDGYITVHMY